MSYVIAPLPDSHAELGEGPHWDVTKQSLFYVDIDEATILRYDYNENKVYRAKIVGAEKASFIIPIDGSYNEFAVGDKRNVIIVNWDGVSPNATIVRTLFKVQVDDRYLGNRFNDAKCDPQGRLFAGTMRYVSDELTSRDGSLFKWEKGDKLDVIKTDVGISNGLAFSEKDKKFYFIDSTDYEVKSYDYDFENGTAKNPKVIYDLRKLNTKETLLPDGMTIDTDGNIYVATFNGATIYKIDPRTANVLLEIKFPTKQITSSVFGGPNLDILYVTTASKGGQLEPAGMTYKVTGLNSKGYPCTNLII